MRVQTAVSLMLTAMALTACGGDTADETLNLAGDNSVCGLKCPTEDLPDPNEDRTGEGTIDNSGNDEKIDAKTGDPTIVLETSVIKNLDRDDPAQSILTQSSNGKTAVIAIDTKTDGQSGWPKPKDMKLFLSENAALGGTGSYREYRQLTRTEQGSGIDEELQVWRWNHSYGIQYRDATGGSEAKHQAWSFGGKRTAAAAVPTSGSANYSGRWGSTAKTWNFIDAGSSPATLSKNGLWRVTGNSQTTIDFGNGKVSSTLRPEAWVGFESRNGEVGFTTVIVGSNSANEFGFMNDPVKLSGKLSKDAAEGNQIVGSATLVPSTTYLTGDSSNPFYGALFGPNANEMTGVFNLEATIPDPTGGTVPINDDRRGYVNHSGVVNGTRQ
jgi:hypothetical protein